MTRPPAAITGATGEQQQPMGTDASTRVTSQALQQQPTPPVSCASSSSSMVTGTPTVANAVGSGCRLLWRGSITVPPEGNMAQQTLHGLAIVAHLFSVPTITTTTASPNALSSSPEVARQLAPASATNPALSRVATGLMGPASPFDDPFASSTTAKSSGADMCLGLEMMRNGTLTVLGQVRATRDQIVTAGGESARKRSGSARKSSSTATKDRDNSVNSKGKQKEVIGNNLLEEELQRVQVETPTDVRVYVDPRCPDTAGWFEDMFCREGRQEIGVRLEVGGEEVIIFASVPPPSSPSTSTSTSTSQSSVRPPLSLLLGRVIKPPPAPRPPRPDDPLPRESIFTAKLRRTSSLSSLDAQHDRSHESGQSSRRSAAKQPLSRSRTSLGSIQETTGTMSGKSNKPTSSGVAAGPGVRHRGKAAAIVQSLLGGNNGSSGSGTSTSHPVRAGSVGATSATSDRDLTATARAKLGRQASLPPSMTTSSSLQSTKALKRSRSMARIDSPPSSPTLPPPAPLSPSINMDVDMHADVMRDEAHPASPTPSASAPLARHERTYGDEGDDRANVIGVDEGENPVTRLKSTADLSVARSQSRRTFNRCESAPLIPSASSGFGSGTGSTVTTMHNDKNPSFVPQGQMPDEGHGADGNKAQTRVNTQQVADQRARAESVRATAEPESIESRNKGTIRKLVLGCLTAAGLSRDSNQFSDIFKVVTQGTAFALRHGFRDGLLSDDDRSRATRVAEMHLSMYLLPLAPLAAVGDQDGRRREGGGGVGQA